MGDWDPAFVPQHSQLACELLYDDCGFAILASVAAVEEFCHAHREDRSRMPEELVRHVNENRVAAVYLGINGVHHCGVVTARTAEVRQRAIARGCVPAPASRLRVAEGTQLLVCDYATLLRALDLRRGGLEVEPGFGMRLPPATYIVEPLVALHDGPGHAFDVSTVLFLVERDDARPIAPLQRMQSFFNPSDGIGEEVRRG